MESSTIKPVTYFCLATFQWQSARGVIATWTGAYTYDAAPGMTRGELFSKVRANAVEQGVHPQANVVFLSMEPNELVSAVSA